MKIKMVGFTVKGAELCSDLLEVLECRGHEVDGFGMKKYVENMELQVLEGSLGEWTEDAFEEYGAVIFISACGIAVRSIAPFVKNKTTDPAVLVIDEHGKFVIPIMSGHFGGANELAEEISQILDAVPVITTATDLNEVFAVDNFAKKHDLYLDDRKLAKKISATLLDGKNVRFRAEFPIKGALPAGLVIDKRDGNTELPGICIGIKDREGEDDNTLNLYPRMITVGIGCRKGAKAKLIEELFLSLLEKKNISIHCIKQIVSIDLKKEEEGILDFCSRYNLPFKTFTKEQLERVEGEFHDSDFVKETTGVGNVCERSAVLGSGNGRLIIPKTRFREVTAAFAIKDWSVEF